MTRTIKVASVQMDVTPAPVDERLARAERLAHGTGRQQHPALASGAWAWSRCYLGAGIPDRD